MVTPEMVISKDRNIQLMVDIWNRLLVEPSTILNFRSTMSEFLEEEVMCSLLRKVFCCQNINRIVIHTFTYITPIQERLFRMIEYAGIELIMLIPFTEKYRNTESVLSTTYSEYMGYPPQDQWIQSEDVAFNTFGEVFEGRNTTADSINLVEYPTLIDFVEDIEDDLETTIFFSADPDSSNDILKNFYPEFYNKRTILSYPIGKFIHTLYEMWDQNSQSIKLDIELLRRCFASGWVPCEDRDSNSYLRELDYIAPFFSGCITLEDWEIRLSDLRVIRSDIISKFRSNSDNDYVRRWENVLGDPFTPFSMFSVEEERIDDVMSMIGSVIDMSRILFEDGGPARIQDHVKKLMDIIEKRGESVTESQMKERRAIMDLLDRLSDSPYESSFFPSDISNAFQYYLSNEMDSDGDEDFGMVHPLYELYGSELSNKKIHICLSDVERLPGSTKDFVWPLTKDCITNIKNSHADETLIEYLIHVTLSGKSNNRFIFYSGFFNESITISWISDNNGKLAVASPYIGLISEMTRITIEKRTKHKITSNTIKSIPPQTCRVKPFKIDRSVLFPEIRADLSICPSKYIYGYILARYPTFNSDFQLSFAIGGLIKVISGLTGNQHEAENNVLSLFPNLLTIEKRQIRDFSDSDKNNSTTRFNDSDYSDKRLTIKYPPAMKSFLKQESGINADNIDPNKKLADSLSFVCMYCAHSDHCIHAHQPIDRGRESKGGIA
ncbi:hypothetical protein AUP07_0687 [methanogenic archaeon mixed culture ISO4-G1]|nr:hypothetical protein AUP07_0687 [methanogenic archaeon mixed culture ISO4-G1]